MAVNGTSSASTAESRTQRQDASANSRIVKKRETDRLAQRANRERTKQRIMLLEEEVDRLKSNNQNAAMLDLMRVVEDQRKENDELQSSLEKIRCIVGGSSGRPTRAPTEQSQSPRNIRGQESSSSDEDLLVITDEVVLPAPDPSESPRCLSTATELSIVEPLAMDTWLAAPTMDDAFTNTLSLDSSAAFSLHVPQQFSYDPYRGLTFLPIAPDELKWDVSNDAFLRALGSAPQVLGPDMVDAHVPFRAILWGWHTIDPDEREHPIWLMLRMIDERVFGAWTSRTQKLALMFITHTLLKFRMNPTPENLEKVPTWLRSRPSQDRVQHPPVIDLLLWPGLRDRLVFEYPEYTKTGEFSSFYCNHLHFYWPFSEDMIYMFDQRTRCFQISQRFKEYAFDLKNWTMDRTFLSRYPELKHDIPALEDRIRFDNRITQLS